MSVSSCYIGAEPNGGLEVVPVTMRSGEQMSLACLAEKLEECRRRLHCALDAAGGNQLDPTVQQVSAEFDRVMNAYMRRQREMGRG